MSETDWSDLLDRFVVSALDDHPSFRRQAAGDRYVYRLDSGDGRTVEIGHSIAHCWLYLDGWETHGIGDPEDLEYELELFVRVALRYLNGHISPPEQLDERDSGLSRPWRRKVRRTWVLEDCPLQLRERR